MKKNKLKRDNHISHLGFRAEQLIELAFYCSMAVAIISFIIYTL